LPADYPNDVLYSPRVNGIEITRYTLASSGSRFAEDRFSFDGGWNSVERPHRVNQAVLEQVLRRRAHELPKIDLRFDHEVRSIRQNGERVTVEYNDLRKSKNDKLTGEYVIGADGGKSIVRKEIGVRLTGGYTHIARAESLFFRSSDVLDLFPGKPAWMNWVINKDLFGNLIAIDGRETWLTHCVMADDEPGLTREDFDRQLELTLGSRVSYEVISQESWQLNRLVAESYRVGRVFLAGDAAHAWPPWAGHGMNSGIEDGITLSWMIAGVLQGWMSDTALDAYQAERLAVGEKVSQAAVKMAKAQQDIAQDFSLRSLLEEPGEIGEQARRDVRNRLLDADSIQFNPQGLNFGIQYDESPIIVYDDGVAPEFHISRYTPSTVPGCRAPHFCFIETGDPLIDRLGIGYTLLVNDDSVDVRALTDAAHKRGLPLLVLDIAHEAAARSYYDHKLTLVRPDRRVAWRDNAVPADPDALIRKLTSATI
jgi:2-polyprenyl-6-methoxyphenol hydroxylase-like FAD-dependent oxidoreductase